MCSPNACKDVFNPNVTTFQSNYAEGLHFSAFHFDLLVRMICYYQVDIILIRIVTTQRFGTLYTIKCKHSGQAKSRTHGRRYCTTFMVVIT